MIVNRRTFNVKPGCMDEILQLLRDVSKTPATGPQANSFRISTAMFGPFDVLAMESEFDDLAHYQKYWGEVFNQPHMANFMEKWVKLTAGGGSNELWEVVVQ
jgi:hypothetical protein